MAICVWLWFLKWDIGSHESNAKSILWCLHTYLGVWTRVSGWSGFLTFADRGRARPRLLSLPDRTAPPPSRNCSQSSNKTKRRAKTAKPKEKRNRRRSPGGRCGFQGQSRKVTSDGYGRVEIHRSRRDDACFTAEYNLVRTWRIRWCNGSQGATKVVDESHDRHPHAHRAHIRAHRHTGTHWLKASEIWWDLRLAALAAVTRSVNSED